jgi:predicted metal-binding membrane protein
MLELVREPDPAEPRSPLGEFEPIWTAAALLAIALVAWVVSAFRMSGMDDGPGTDLGSLGWFVAIWVPMMAAMMFPSLEPTVLLCARIADLRRREGRAGFAPTATFVGGYLAVWTVFGLLAFGAYELVAAFDPTFLAWGRAGPYLAGGAILAAGLYEMTPLKRYFLDHCRNPFQALFFDWRSGPLGGSRMGVRHAGHCVGCCAGLMIVLFALGIMSLVWMAAVAAVIFFEKVFMRGSRLRWLVAVGLIAVGVWVAVSPGSVPALVQPGAAAPMLIH